MSPFLAGSLNISVELSLPNHHHHLGELLLAGSCKLFYHP